MKKHIWQSVVSILTSMILLTACTNKEAVSAKPEPPTASPQEETVLVYRISEEIMYNNNDSNSNENGLTEALRFEYEYDADGNKTRQTGYDSYGNGNTLEYTYDFDTDAIKVRETYCDNDNSSAQKWVDYQYDTDGEMTQRAYWQGNDYMVTRFYDADADCPAIALISYPLLAALGDSDVMRYISYNNGAVTEFATAQYDADGNKVRETIYLADGSPLYSYEYDYDADGNITRETVYDADGALLNTGMFAYRYDEHGNVLEQRRYLNGNFTGMTKYNYIQLRALCDLNIAQSPLSS